MSVTENLDIVTTIPLRSDLIINKIKCFKLKLITLKHVELPTDRDIY